MGQLSIRVLSGTSLLVGRKTCPDHPSELTIYGFPHQIPEGDWCWDIAKRKVRVALRCPECGRVNEVRAFRLTTGRSRTFGLLWLLGGENCRWIPDSFKHHYFRAVVWLDGVVRKFRSFLNKIGC